MEFLKKQFLKDPIKTDKKFSQVPTKKLQIKSKVILDKKFEMGMYTLLYLNRIINNNLL